VKLRHIVALIIIGLVIFFGYYTFNKSEVLDWFEHSKLAYYLDKYTALEITYRERMPVQRPLPEIPRRVVTKKAAPARPRPSQPKLVNVNFNLSRFSNLDSLEGLKVYLVTKIESNKPVPPVITGRIKFVDEEQGITSISSREYTFNSGNGNAPPNIIYYPEYYFVVVETGTYNAKSSRLFNTRNAELLLPNFISYGNYFFWQDFVIHSIADQFDNRPWGEGEAYGIEAININTGRTYSILRADRYNQFSIKKIEDSDLIYLRTAVGRDIDWDDFSKYIKSYEVYDLERLLTL
jgi:hypothetical protein